MVDFPWGSLGSLTTYLSTTLNALGIDTTDLGSTVIDNQTNLDTFMDLELTLDGTSYDISAQSNPSVTVYLIESVDGGTDYDTATDNTSDNDLVPPSDKIVAVIGVRPGTGAEGKVAIKSMIPIPPSKFKLMVRNETGVALASTGNVLAYRTYTLGSS